MHACVHVCVQVCMHACMDACVNVYVTRLVYGYVSMITYLKWVLICRSYSYALANYFVIIIATI